MPEPTTAPDGSPLHPGYDVTVIDQVGGFDTYLGPIRDSALVAASDWFSHILGQGTVDIEVLIAQVPSNTASGGPADVRFSGQTMLEDKPVQLVEPSLLTELGTGLDAQATVPEIRITLDPDRLNSATGSYWFDPDPFDADHSVPGTLVDGVRAIEHEIGHGLGMVGYRPLSSGSLAGQASPFDTFVAFMDGQPYFTGAKAEAVYGGPVPLTPHNFYHYGTDFGGDMLGGVMNGVASPVGPAAPLSDLDFAIMGDLGYQMSDYGPTVYSFYEPASDSQFYTADAAERDGILANSPAMQYEGAAFQAASAAISDLAVYHFLNTANGSHFYTADVGERDAILQGNPNFAFEGVAYHAYADDGGGTHQPLFRFYRPDSDTYFYTASLAERDGVIATQPAYQYEGIAFDIDLL
jgi:hypothetical protein